MICRMGGQSRIIEVLASLKSMCIVTSLGPQSAARKPESLRTAGRKRGSDFLCVAHTRQACMGSGIGFEAQLARQRYSKPLHSLIPAKQGKPVNMRAQVSALPGVRMACSTAAFTAEARRKATS